MLQRIAYFDMLRGIAIIGVVAIHSTGIGLLDNDTSLDFLVTAFWRQLINFSVPLFLALSGYFMAKKKVESKSDYLIFLKSQIPRVLIPYLIWSILYSIPLIMQGSSIKEILFKFISFQISIPFYFILLIVQYYFLLPFLKKMGTKKGVINAGIISGMSCIIVFLIRYYFKVNLPTIIYAGIFSTWLVFFVFGIYVRTNELKIKNNVVLILLIISLMLSITETLIVYKFFKTINESVTAVKISSFFYSFIAILFLFKHSQKKITIPNILLYIGGISLGIYFSHMIFQTIINAVINKTIPQLSSYAIIYQVVLISSTLICCTIFAIMSKKVSRNFANKYLGQ